MDVYLSEEALLFLEGQALDSAAGRGGLLLGHKRGPRFFVEKAFPCRSGFFLSPANFWALDRHFRGKIIGFYAFGPGPKKKSGFFRPFACGKVYLEVRPGQKKMRLKPSVIEYKDAFFLQPVALCSASKERI
ncbi:MAG: hypothetical protein FJY81_05580 [Candidatus Aminicenantes bacterium]|nr:hypothetical protein [Candidatus Aminicenantes bacterium]